MPTCYWCKQEITDGKEESGYTGVGPDWMVDGDFGCDANPCTNEDGCGGHRTKAEALEIYRRAELGLKQAWEDATI